MPLYNKALYNQALPGTGVVTSAPIVTMKGAATANSTTYVDLLGVLAGLERNSGETAADFADRIARASVLPRGADYIGLINELCLQLGFEIEPAIHIEADGGVVLRVTLSGVHAAWGSSILLVPILEIGPDSFWAWRSLSDVVADLNASGLAATLLVPDGPAVQLVRQTNLLPVVGENISGQFVKLAHPGLVDGTQLFNQPVPAYTIQADSVLFFAAPLPAGTRVTYQYQVYPYDLLACPVFLLGLLDPELGTLAVTPEGKLVYQMREYVQELATNDRSYWAV